MNRANKLDQEIVAFIQQTLNFYPADAVDASVDQQRQWYNELCAAYRQERPAGLQVRDSLVEGKDNHQIPIRTYQVGVTASAQQVLYAHGGGFVVGGLESHDDVCAEIASRCQVDVVSVDYRLAPEFHYPQDLHDCLAVLDGLLANGHQVILAGDSAGGALSACVANSRIEACGEKIIGQVLIYPSLVKDWNTPSMIEHANAPMLTKDDMEYYLPMRTNGEPSPFDDPGFVAMANKDLSGLPPTHLFPAEVDPLCDDCEIYAAALQAAGVDAVNHLNVGQGLVHGHLRARNVSQKAKICFDEICKAVDLLLKQ